MSLERHGDFAPIMLTNELSGQGYRLSKLLPKDGRYFNHHSALEQVAKRAKTPF